MLWLERGHNRRNSGSKVTNVGIEDTLNWTSKVICIDEMSEAYGLDGRDPARSRLGIDPAPRWPIKSKLSVV